MEKITNLFDIDDKFWNIYLELQKEYNFDNYTYSEKDNHPSLKIESLINDLCEKLNCFSVEIICYSNKDIITLTKYKNEESIIENLVIREKIIEKIKDLHIIERHNGDSFIISDINLKGLTAIDIDILPVSGNSNGINNDASIYLFVLVCGSALKDIHHKAERQFQRLLLCQLLKDWWFKIAKTSLPNSMFDSSYAISLSDLIKINLQKGNIEIERRSKTFNWNLWNPQLSFFFLNNESVAYIRKYSESLVYWCKWIDLHKDLEIKNDKEYLKEVIIWVNEQRKEFHIIGDQLKNLSDLSANEFIAGNIEFCQKVNLPKASDDLPLQRKSLLIFCLNKWVGIDSIFLKELQSGVLSNVEFCRSLHAIGSVSHYLFCQQALSDDIIHRLMQLISKYGHSELGIPSRLDLRAHLLHAVRGEPALYVLKSFYRDHFFHAIEVCFLGHFLLEIKVNDNTFLWQIVAKKLDGEVDKNTVLRLWYTTALLHDVGYAMDMFNNSQKYLDFFKHSEALNIFTKEIREIKKKLEKAKEIGDLGLGDSFFGMEDDHGIVGALHLQSLIKVIQKEDENVTEKEYKPAIHAIAMHNLRRKEDRIYFSSHPIAFLLAFCDQIQEWNRFRMPFSISPNIILSKLTENGGKIDNLFGGISNVFINNIETSQNNGEIEIKLKDNEKLEFTLEYTDQINKNSSVFSLWLDSTLNFQRLDFEGLPFDIKVNFKTPCFHDVIQGTKIPQLHRLRNAAHETHMTFLSDWFPKEKNGILITNGPVDYFEDNGIETLSLNLKQLSLRRLMTKDMGAFYKRLREWKQFNDDRDFPGDYVEVYPE